MSPRRWDAWIALWLRAYPRAFRARFGRDLAAQYPSPTERTAASALAAARELVRGGLGARADDRQRARRRGSPGGGLDGLRSDTAQATRSLTRRPWFAAMVTSTLALAAGLNAAVFGILDVTLLRPLPYGDEERLVSIGLKWTGFTHTNVSLPEFVDFRERARSFDALAVYNSTSVNLASSGGTAERIQGASATASLFDVLGVSPLLGRAYTAAEEADGTRVVAISHGFWTRRFGADPSVVGQDLVTDSGPVRIVGVMPASFRFPSADTDVWRPMYITPDDASGRGAHSRQVIGRLALGVPIDAARDEMRGVAAGLMREYPASYAADSGFGVSVRALREHLVGDLRSPLEVLMTAVLFVLLIACANVANLMVARTTERRRETATRVAFGATRLRLVRQSLIEGLLTGAAGGAGGVLLGAWLMQVLGPWLPDALPRPDAMLTDARVMTFALVVTAAAGSLTAAFTAVRATRVSTTDALKGTRATADAQRTRTVLTVAQVALSVMLLVCGGFAARSFMRLLDTSPGLRTEQIVTARVALASTRYPTVDARAAFFDRVHDMLLRQPGVTAAGAVSLLPLSGQFSDWSFGVEGWAPPTPGDSANEQTRSVHGDYFQMLDIPVVAGRLFTRGDTAHAPDVAIVSRLFARKYWKDGDAVGRRIRLGRIDSDRPWTTIVGVVADIRHLALNEEPVPFLYLPASQVPSSTMTLLARLGDGVSGGPELIAGSVRAVDVEQPTWSPRTMEEWLARTVSEPRFNLLLLSIFGGLAVLLAGIGIYGVMAFGVSRRTRELGIRVALGAQPASLMRAVLREGAMLTGMGLLLGGAAGLLAGRSLAVIFHDVRLADPVVLTVIPLFVLAVATVASYVPARRAMRIDPVIALRAD